MYYPKMTSKSPYEAQIEIYRNQVLKFYVLSKNDLRMVLRGLHKELQKKVFKFYVLSKNGLRIILEGIDKELQKEKFKFYVLSDAKLDSESLQKAQIRSYRKHFKFYSTTRLRNTGKAGTATPLLLIVIIKFSHILF